MIIQFIISMYILLRKNLHPECIIKLVIYCLPGSKMVRSDFILSTDQSYSCIQYVKTNFEIDIFDINISE